MKFRATSPTEFIGHVDNAEVIMTPSGQRYLLVAGWLLHNKFETRSIAFSLPEKTPASAELHTRPDVPKWLPDIPHSDRSGYLVKIPVEETFDDTHATLQVDITLQTGDVVTCPLSVVIKRYVPNSPIRSSSTSPYGNTDAYQSINSFWKLQFQTFIEGRERILFEPCDAPQISVIIVLHNQAHVSYVCLKSLLEQQGLGIEVIIVDNASNDQTAALLSRIHGARIIRNTENLHFLLAANQGATFAQGSYLLFLNNDTMLLSGALGAALNVFKNETRVGAVGAKLIRPDGKLQEAGSFIGHDGSTLGIAVGEDPDHPVAQARADVDYCSGAFLLTPRSLFNDLRMFDDAYKPGYYEDVDYCVKLKEYGYRVVYEPRATVIHLQHASSSSRKDAQQLMARNKVLFAQRHASFLANKSVSAPTKHQEIRRILFIDDTLPRLVHGQGQPRTKKILEFLAERNIPVTFVTINQDNQLDRQALKEYKAIDEHYELSRDALETLLRTKGMRYSHIFVSRPTNMEQVSILREKNPLLFRSIKIIFDSEALFALRDIRKKEVLDNIAFSESEIKHIVSLETRLARDADSIITVSDSEFMWYGQAGYHHIHKLSHSVEIANSTAPFETRRGIITLGPHLAPTSPNVDALAYFLRDIFPHITNDEIKKNFRVGGILGSSSLPFHPDLNLLGKIDDAQTFYDSARVFVAPTRYGAGIPLKVIEAAAGGIPCVVSGFVADQLGWEEDHEYLVGRTPKEFATQLERLYSDQLLWNNVQKKASKRVEKDFNKTSFQSALDGILASVS